MPTPITVAVYLWAGWLTTWLLAAFWSSRPVARQPLPQRLLHLGLLAGGAILLFGHPAQPWLNSPLLPLPSWVPWCTVAGVAVGVSYAWWARLHLGRHWSGTVTLKEEHALIRTGPYRLTRHPIYSGLLLALLATALLQDEAAAVLGVSVVVLGLLLKIHAEERLLREHFGPQYEEYRAAVPALIPQPWRHRSLTTA